MERKQELALIITGLGLLSKAALSENKKEMVRQSMDLTEKFEKELNKLIKEDADKE